MLKNAMMMFSSHATKEAFKINHYFDCNRTYSQMHRTDKYSENSSIIWPVWPNG